ncbi:MAG: MFS transporter [Pseudohongiella sp.]|nr:MFS transporter [Pseudohongiella sp.]
MENSVPHRDQNRRDRKDTLRKTLRYSHQEAVASATMTGTNDNFLNAFAISLQATALQMGWLTAIPQLFGAIWQIVSVWMGNHAKRKSLVVGIALLQSVIVGLLALLAVAYGRGALQTSRIHWLIILAVGYFSCINIIQPHWRAWMGSLVPRSRRGVFFAARSRLTMAASLLVFISGGIVLSYTDADNRVWLGFALLFGAAASGRLISSFLLWRMHDPEPESSRNAMRLRDSWLHVRESLKDPTFRHYSFLVACLQGAVALSAPFFAVYLLRDLQFTYLQFSLNSIASIATQFLMLHFWGRFSDRFGNHLVMVISGCMIPIIPLLWLVSPDPVYLLFVQVVSGIFWSGFTLSTANYLYDIRPHQTNFSLYAAIQSGTGALMVFCGGLLGGYLATHAPEIATSIAEFWEPGSDLYIVFITTAILRAAVVAYFLPLLKEPKIRKRPKFLEVIFRVARINAISGVSLDWMSVSRKRTKRDLSQQDTPKEPD